MRQASLTLTLVSLAVTAALMSACGDVEKNSPEKKPEIFEVEKKEAAVTASPASTTKSTVPAKPQVTKTPTVTDTKMEAPALSNVVTVGIGAYHTCALLSTGGVKCWGAGFSGQLGNNSTLERLKPIAVNDLSSGVTDVSNGFNHTCALISTGGVKCWGTNLHGQLGDNSTTERLVPVDVFGLSNAKAISTGYEHTCVLLHTGGVKCWGSNSYGQVGSREFKTLVPVDVTDLSIGVSAISSGNHHTCALLNTGGVKCWGENDDGQVGGSSSEFRSNPVNVDTLSNGVSAIAAGGNHTCALMSNGGVKCWGKNEYGQLGDKSNLNRLTPINVDGLSSGVISISAGQYHTCAVVITGGVTCWGYNSNGQLGDGSKSNRSIPSVVANLSSGVTRIFSSNHHTCALLNTKGVKCWGRNNSGQLGDNSTEEKLTPLNVLE